MILYIYIYIYIYIQSLDLQMFVRALQVIVISKGSVCIRSIDWIGISTFNFSLQQRVRYRCATEICVNFIYGA